MGWTFPWASSANTDFNSDYAVSFTESQQRAGIEYNYRREQEYSPESAARSGAFQWREGQEAGAGAEQTLAAMSGTDVPTYHRDRPGMSAFVLEDGIVYHTYSAYARASMRFGVCIRG